MQEQIIGQVVSNAIVTTAYLANELCIQTNGEFILPESDYIHYVKEFQMRLAKRIMPVKTTQDIKDEAKKYISEILASAKECENASINSGENGKELRSEAKD